MALTTSRGHPPGSPLFRSPYDENRRVLWSVLELPIFGELPLWAAGDPLEIELNPGLPKGVCNRGVSSSVL